MRERAVTACMLAVLTCFLPQSVAAQTSGELSIGYSFLSNDELAVNASSLPAGVFVGSAIQVNDFFSLAFDLNAHFKRGIEPSADTVAGGGVVTPLASEDFQSFSFNQPEAGFCSVVLTVCDVSIQTVGAVMGPRIHFSSGRARPFVQGMVGFSRSLRKIGFFAHTATHLATQAGAGVDIDMTDNTAFRVQGNYRTVFFPDPDQTDPKASLVNRDGANFNNFTFSFGVVVKLGAHRR